MNQDEKNLLERAVNALEKMSKEIEELRRVQETQLK